jgi:hypothetical protein
MNLIRYTRRLAAALAGLAAALVAFGAAPAFASLPPGHGGPAAGTALPRPPGWNKHPPLPPGHFTGPVHTATVPAHTVVIGGMPGWQIALIAIAAALVAATVAVLVDRARAARRRLATAAA